MDRRSGSSIIIKNRTDIDDISSMAEKEGLEVAVQPLLRCPKFITAWGANEL